jgi:hypothetical protein
MSDIDHVGWSIPILLGESLHDLRGGRYPGCGEVLSRVAESRICRRLGLSH